MRRTMTPRARLAHFLQIVLAASISVCVSACGGSSGNSASVGTGGNTGNGSTGSSGNPAPSATHEWTWISGSNMAGANGVYGSLGVGSASNTPGARGDATSMVDTSGNLWLFAGASGNSAFNDLWEFVPSTRTWTWVSGSNAANAEGVYGTQEIASTSDVPGARSSALGWADASGNLWVFGGTDSGTGILNDLWEFNPAAKTWMWVSGSNTANAKGIYGTLGVATSGNVPGARGNGSGGPSLGWTDSSGNFWLFGGYGYDSAGTLGLLNDLWEFSPTTKMWTWVSGSNTVNAMGVYGTQGVAAASNVPGARGYSVGWTDKSGNLWLYGGYNAGANGDLSDLWEFSLTTKMWTWVSGSNTGGVVPVYGTLGTPSANNTPGGRDSAVSWTDSSGNFWLFGGFDLDSATGANGTNQYLNDLWEFNPTTKEWTWIGGSDTGGANGVYGTLGVAAASNVPGARGSQGVSVSWTDKIGNFWLFGGEGYAATGSVCCDLNDLWVYAP